MHFGIDEAVNSVFGALLIGIFGYMFYYFRQMADRDKRNKVNEINLVTKEIEIKNNSMSFDDLVNKSNERHGAVSPKLGQSTGDDPEKK